jgi:hypothetical protein
VHVHPHSTCGDGFEECRAKDARQPSGDNDDDIYPVGLPRDEAQPSEQAENRGYDRVRQKGVIGRVRTKPGGESLADITRLSRNISWAHQDCIGLAESQLDAIGPGRESRAAHQRLKFARQ